MALAARDVLEAHHGRKDPAAILLTDAVSITAAVVDDLLRPGPRVVEATSAARHIPPRRMPLTLLQRWRSEAATEAFRGMLAGVAERTDRTISWRRVQAGVLPLGGHRAQHVKSPIHEDAKQQKQ